MRIGELIEFVNRENDVGQGDIDRDKIYYYVRSGFIGPQTTSSIATGVRHYDFSSREDALMVQLIWAHHSRGVAPRIAYQRALDERKQPRLRL